MSRTGEYERKTGETYVKVRLELDGEGRAQIKTGVGFLDHILHLLSHHSGMDLAVAAEGDTWVDDHHTVEDTGLVLGRALDEALGDRTGLTRFADASAPLIEALSTAVVDLGGRSHLTCNLGDMPEKIGTFDTELFSEFLRAFTQYGRFTLHLNCHYGENAHHKVESGAKALAIALREGHHTSNERYRLDERGGGLRVAVVDYDAGNTFSVTKALEKVGARVDLTPDPKRVSSADAVVLPGVGAFGDCMEKLRSRGMDEVCSEAYRSGKPFLGVCVGLQVLFEDSEESPGAEGLGLLPGRVSRFAGEGLRVPHMGWNRIMLSLEHPVLNGLDGEAFYFVHSYKAEPVEGRDLMARCDYGGPFCAVAGRENLIAVQFHPEKSSHAGLKLYENFLSWARSL